VVKNVREKNIFQLERADCFGLAQMYQLRGAWAATSRLRLPAHSDESLLTADARKR